MRDPQTAVFRKRLKRIDRIHRRGGGFEADGTLGQSFYTRQQRKGFPILKPALYVFGGVIASKAALLISMGGDEYLARVADLQDGSSVERAGAFLMGVDPLTLKLAGLVAPLFGV